MAYSFLPTEIVTVIEQHTWRNYEILLRWRHTVGWHVLLYSGRTPVEKLPNFTHKRRESFFQQSSHQAIKCEYSLNVSCKHQNITLLSCLRSNFKSRNFESLRYLQRPAWTMPLLSTFLYVGSCGSSTRRLRRKHTRTYFTDWSLPPCCCR